MRKMKKPLFVYWTRRDFRLHDNPALTAVIKASQQANTPVLPLFILENYMTEGNPKFQFGYPSQFFLSKALPVWKKKLTELEIVSGKAAAYFLDRSKDFDLSIFVNEDVHPDFYKQIKKIKQAGIKIQIFSDMMTVSKETKTGQGNIYSVFTPFKNNVWAEFINSKPLPPAKVKGLHFADITIRESFTHRIKVIESEIFETFSKKRSILIGKAGTQVDLTKLTKLPNLSNLYWSEEEARHIFKTYLKSDNLSHYKNKRDSLEEDVETENIAGVILHGKTSKMSLALAWGLISARTLVHKIQKYFDEQFDNPLSNQVDQGALCFISELIWREFYKYLLFHSPSLLNTEFQKKYRGTISWTPHKEALRRFEAWIKGETGYPVVDAAMKQLAKTGWMHNRSRMIVASVLTKNLGVDWRWGQEYFRATLIDLDEASNNGGWQWGASVGADPKPIRIFNPELQAKNYDASGKYQDTWLGHEGSTERLKITPIIEHKDARNEAIKRYGLSQ